MLRRLVTWSYDRRRLVVVMWAALVVASSVLGRVAGGETVQDFAVPGSDSAKAVNLLRERFPQFAGGSVDVVYTAADGVTDPDTVVRIEALVAALASADHVLAAERRPVAPDGSTGVVQVRFDQDAQQLPVESVLPDLPVPPGRPR